jgi:hypothetical protein
LSPCRSRERDDTDRRGPPVGGRERKGRGRRAGLRGRGKVGRREGEFGPEEKKTGWAAGWAEERGFGFFFFCKSLQTNSI